MIRFSYVIVFLFAALPACMAQQFREGYIQNKDSKYVYGYVGGRVTGKPEGVEFKENRDGDAKIFQANEILGYGFLEGNRYHSHQNSTDESDWVFLDIAVDGELMLIVRSGMFFLKKKNESQFIHLNPVANAYRKELAASMNACPAVQNRTNRVKFSRSDLEDIVNDYNKCSTGETVSYAGLPPPLRLALLVGGDVTPMVLVSGTTNFLVQEKMNDLDWLSAGASVSLRRYSLSTKIGLNTGIYYNKGRFAEATVARLAGSSTQQNEFTIVYSELKIPVAIEFIPASKSKFMKNFRVGVILPKVFGLNSTWTEATDANGVVYLEEGQALNTLRKGIQFQTSLAVDRKLFGEHLLRFEAGWSIGRVQGTSPATAEPSFRGRTQSVTLLAGFVF